MFSDFVSVCISEFLSGLRFSNRVFRLCFGLCNRICSGTVIHNSSHYATQRQMNDAWAYLSPAYFFFPLCLSFFFSFVHLLIFCFIFFFWQYRFVCFTCSFPFTVLSCSSSSLLYQFPSPHLYLPSSLFLSNPFPSPFLDVTISLVPLSFDYYLSLVHGVGSIFSDSAGFEVLELRWRQWTMICLFSSLFEQDFLPQFRYSMSACLLIF